jgi:hypothetical protein
VRKSHAVVVALVAVVASGCTPALRGPEPQLEKRGDDDVPSAAAEVSKPNPARDCYGSFRVAGDEKADLGRLTKACGAAQRRLSPPRLGTQGENDPVQRYTFVAGGPGRCYRVYAASGAGVRDLDLMLRAPDGRPLVRDETTAPFAVVPASSALCLPEEGVYQLEISVARGSGSYAVEVWTADESSTPPPAP